MYDEQQIQLAQMMEEHRTQNEAWLGQMKSENDAERKALEEERVSVSVSVSVSECEGECE